MGEVYAAYDPELDRKVAVKVIHASMRGSGAPATARARLVREAQTLARLSHPNVVGVYDVGELDGDVYVAMEFVEGLELRAWIEIAKRDAAEILDVFLAAGRGLAAAHDAGLAHRDFKPENVLIGVDGRVRIIDFGIARLTDGHGDDEGADGAAGARADDDTDTRSTRQLRRSESDALIANLSSQRKISSSLETRAGALVGTPTYMAPEQFLGSAADARSDQFSFCIALWEALAGERPFAGENIADLSAAVLDDERRPLPAGHMMPSHVSRGIERGLANRPADRYASMNELLEVIAPPPPRATRPAVIAALALLAAIGAAVLVFAFTGKSENPCADVGDDAANVWTAEARAASERAFIATGDSNAAAVFERVATALDDYTREWSAARLDVCEASRVRKEQSDELTEKRLACLDERLGEMRVVVTLVSAANKSFVENAIETTRGLARVADCSNLARLAGSPEIPSELATSLAKIQALGRSRDLDEGTKLAVATLARAKELGNLAGEARARAALATLQRRAGAHETALEGYFAAVRVADDARDTRAEAEAWIEIVRLVGSQLQRFAEARRWSEHAALAIRQDGSDLVLEARLRQTLAWIDRTRGDYQASLDDFEQALELYQKVGGMKLEELSAKAGISSALRNLERHEEAVNLQREVVAGRAEIFGKDDPQMSSAYSSLASSLTALKRYDEARNNYRLALELRAARSGADDPGQAWMIRDLGLLEERVGNYARARELFERERTYRQERYGENHPRVFEAQMSLARLDRRAGDLEGALAVGRDVERGLRALGPDARVSLARALSEQCDLRRRLRDLAGAARDCKEAIEVFASDAPDPRELAGALTRAARVALEQQRDEDAATWAEQALEIRREHKSDARDTIETLYVASRARLTSLETRRSVPTLLAEIDALAADVHPGEDDVSEDVAALRRDIGK